MTTNFYIYICIYCKICITTQPLPWNKLLKLNVHDRVKMFLWRLRSDMMPTKEKLGQRIGATNKSCSLCNACVEDYSHLFLYCHVAKRAIWIGVPLGIRSDNLDINNHVDIIKLVVDLLAQFYQSKEEANQCSLVMAIPLEAIWNLKNVCFSKGKG